MASKARLVDDTVGTMVGIFNDRAAPGLKDFVQDAMEAGAHLSDNDFNAVIVQVNGYIKKWLSHKCMGMMIARKARHGPVVSRKDLF